MTEIPATPIETVSSSPTTPKPNPSMNHLMLLLLLVIILVAGGYYYYINQHPSTSVSPNNSINPAASVKTATPKTPYQELESAIDKSVAAKTAYIDYKTAVSSRIFVTKTGLTQTSNNNVDGYISGSTDGNSSKMEMRIYNSETPSAQVVISTISLENGDLYIKGPATGTKWKQTTKTDAAKLDEGSPTDASLYGFNILATVFSENKALFKTINKETVQKLQDSTVEGKTLSNFSVEISIPDFLTSINSDKEATEKDKSDSKKILADSVMKATFSVDKSTNYISELKVTASNLTQITTPASEQLGVSTHHDLVLTAQISRYDIPAQVVAPDPSEVTKDKSV